MSATAVQKLTDAELDALITEGADAFAKYQQAQQEKYRRETEAEEKEEQEKKEKVLSSAAYKKLAEKYKKATEAVTAACGTKELTLMLPITFAIEASCIENYIPDFDNAFDDSETSASIANNSPGVNKKQKVILEEGLNNLLNQIGDNIDDLFSEWNDEQKAALAEFQKAHDRVVTACGKKEFTSTLPVTFSCEVSENDWGNYDLCGKNFSDVFERGTISATIGNAAGISKKQKAMLQDGLDRVIEDACDTVYEVFFDATKEQESALADLNKVLTEAEKMGLDWDDLN